MGASKDSKNTTILDSKWVFALKEHEEDEQNRYKARLVARGFAQPKEFDYDEIYSPVAKVTTLKTLLAVGNERSFHFEQLDVKSAFLNGELKDSVYLKPPEGDNVKPNYVYKLKKALYGLKEAAKCWNNSFNDFMKECCFERSENDSCLYWKRKGNEIVYLLLYVDDIIIASERENMLREIKEKLMKRFKMKDKGKLRYFLGLEITHNRGDKVIQINQKKYIEKLLKRFNFENCKSSDIPIEPKLVLVPCDNQEQTTEKPYRQLIGCLTYLMMNTRPDICYALHYFSKFQNSATDEIWKHLTRILRYIKGTINYALTFRAGGNQGLEAYADAGQMKMIESQYRDICTNGMDKQFYGQRRSSTV